MIATALNQRRDPSVAAPVNAGAVVVSTTTGA